MKKNKNLNLNPYETRFFLSFLGEDLPASLRAWEVGGTEFPRYMKQPVNSLLLLHPLLPLPSLTTPAILKPVVEAQNLGKRYGDRWVLRNLTFSLKSGDCLIVTGKNGGGKSTLLKVLSGLERPTTGTVKTETTDYRTELSYCALDQATFANLTVTEHLSLAAKMRGIQSEDSTLIHNCGLNEHKDHQAQYLSSGLRSRLKIAIAIQSNPKILLWDEPGVALDGAGKALIERIIGEQKQRGVLVIATNDLDERRFGTHELELV